MITKNILLTGSICGLICVAFMWTFMFFTGMQMTMKGGEEMNMDGMHMMPDGTMMSNNGTQMNMGSMTMDDMVNDLKGKTGKELEKEFLLGMVPHHQGAVDMAKLLLQDKTISPQIANFAKDIIQAQETEINMMNSWLKNY